MAVIHKTRAEKLREFFARYSGFTKAAAILVLAFFVVCACTIGGFNAPGRAYYAQSGSELVFYLQYDSEKSGEEQKLGQIYVNIGAVYESVGSDVKLNFRRASTSSSSWLSSSSMGDVSFGNVYSSEAKGISGANYNWVKVFDFTQESSGSVTTTYKLIKLEVPCDMLINEVVFFDKGGDVIPAVVDAAQARELIGESAWKKVIGDRTIGDYFRGNDATKTLGDYGDPNRVVDAQKNVTSGSSVYSNFTQDEMYTLMQIDNILLGSRVPDGTFNADTDNGPLAVLFPLLGTLVFGKSVFGLRIFSVLFTAACVALVYLFGRRLFKGEGFAFLSALLFAGGGLALTVGRLGLAFAPVAFFMLASYFCMYKFFADGIAADRPAKSACGSILLSGIFFALAFAADPKSVVAAVGVIALFVLGAVKQARQYAAARRALRQEMLDKNASERSEEVMRANIEACERAEAAARSEHAYKVKLTCLLFVVGFIAAAIAAVMLAVLPSYTVLTKLYEPDPANPSAGIFSLVGKAIRGAFVLDNATSYAAGNAVSAFGWFLSLKGATLYSAHTESLYLALNAQLNVGMAITALVSVLFMTVYAVLYAVTGGKNGQYASEHAPAVLRAYLVLLFGLVSSLLQFAFLGGASAMHGYLFDLFYIAFIPLMFCTVYLHDGSEAKKIFGIRMNSTAKVMAALLAVYAIIFLLSLPMTFGIPVPYLAATICFGWTTFINNGYYRIG